MTVACMWCGTPTGVRGVDPWTIPPGVMVSLVVSCEACVEANRAGAVGQVEWRRPDGERPTPDPLEGEVATVIVMRHLGAYAVTAVRNGEVRSSASGIPTRAEAFDVGVRAIERQEPK